MDLQNLFTNSIKQLEKQLPQLATYLRHHWRKSTLVFTETTLYFSFDNYTVLYVHGLSEFIAFEKYIDKHTLVFIEEETDWWLAFLQHPKSKKFLDSKNVYFKTFVDPNKFAEQLSWEFLFESVYFYKSLNKKPFLKEIVYYENLSNNISSYSFLKNDFDFFCNYKYLDQAINGLQLNLTGVPVIICGAGPSLEKIKDKLPYLLQNYFVIAAGASVNILNHWGFSPHLAVAIDPSIRQEEYFLKRKDFVTPYAYRHRLYSKALSLIHGPKLYIKGISDQPIVEAIDEDLGIKEKTLSGGFSSVTFATRLAHYFNCSSILFLGVDLSYKKEKKYASKVLEKDLTLATETEELGVHWDGRVEDVDQYGNPITTSWRWKAEARWLSIFADSYPEILWHNGSEGGVNIPGISNESVFNKGVQRPYHDLIHSSIQLCHPLNTNISSVFSLWIEETERCISLLDRLLESMGNLEDYTLFEVELEENRVYQSFLLLKKMVYSKVLEKETCILGKNENNYRIYLYLLESCIELEKELIDVGYRRNKT
jgi:hypothetical protein